jgi:hypothetical protein
MHRRNNISRTRSPDRNIWTRLILAIPNVSINRIHAPKRTSISGKPIEKVEHHSDLMRKDMVQKYGGLYLVGNFHVLGDLTPLRESGFINVVGREFEPSEQRVLVVQEKLHNDGCVDQSRTRHIRRQIGNT